MNVFIDCGTHFGQGLRHFINKFEIDHTWSVHTFEANPTTYQIYLKEYHKKNNYVKHYNFALSNFDGTINLNIETPPNNGDTGQGTSIVSLNYWNPHEGKIRENFKNSCEVSCLSLSNFIKNNFNQNDKIIIKMDIEGAEYDVLEEMIKDKTIDWVDYIAIEWHSRFFINKEEILDREKKILDQIDKNKIEGWV